MKLAEVLMMSFVTLTISVALLNAAIVAGSYHRARGPKAGKRAFGTAVIVLGVWMSLHAFMAESGLLVDEESIPPPMMPYLLVTMATAAAFVFTKPGAVVARHAPMFALVGLQAFRLPLEIWLHKMYEHGEIPIQMTWSGWNFDVVTGISALVVAVLAWRQQAPKWLLWAWNTVGMALLVAVMVLANLSAPTAFRAFHDGPSLDVVIETPYNWIASVLVATALVGHLLVYRKLLSKPQ